MKQFNYKKKFRNFFRKINIKINNSDNNNKLINKNKISQRKAVEIYEFHINFRI